MGFGEVAERLRRSTVHIGTGGRGHGSGIIVKSGANSALKSDAVIVTNAHVAAVGPPGGDALGTAGRFGLALTRSTAAAILRSCAFLRPTRTTCRPRP